MPLFSWMMIDLYGYEINSSTYIDLNYIFRSILGYQINYRKLKYNYNKTSHLFYWKLCNYISGYRFLF